MVHSWLYCIRLDLVQSNYMSEKNFFPPSHLAFISTITVQEVWPLDIHGFSRYFNPPVQNSCFNQTWEKLDSFHDPNFVFRKFPQKCVSHDITNTTSVFYYNSIPWNYYQYNQLQCKQNIFIIHQILQVCFQIVILVEIHLST